MQSEYISELQLGQTDDKKNQIRKNLSTMLKSVKKQFLY